MIWTFGWVMAASIFYYDKTYGVIAMVIWWFLERDMFNKIDQLNQRVIEAERKHEHYIDRGE